ncbi:MAG: NAD(P)-dependent alcohol dehydrogenase [Clostridiales bacterium]|nr:NAD(P)-dependent alcohol dehydrogenase [Clostridiales bacterium]
MKAILATQYGSPDVLHLMNVEKPTPKSNEVLIHIRASSVNSADHRLMRATPAWIRIMGMGLLRPKKQIPGVDMAGVVEAVGSDVKRFKPGDEVYGDVLEAATGAFAEYVSVPEDIAITIKPKNMTFEQAASVPVAGITALQALRDRAQIKAGDKVLINGASGGVGTFAVMLAKAFGANVTGVCSTKNLDLVRSIGADHVVDYRKQDVTKLHERYNVILDIAANIKAGDYQRLLAPGGRGVLVGFSKMSHMAGIMMKGKKLLKRYGLHVKMLGNSHTNPKDLDILRELMEAGKITPAIDKTYPLEKTADALRYFENEHARAKIDNVQ